MSAAIRLPNPEDLSIFCRVARCMLTDDGKSLARHAHDLGLSKSRVERSILRLSAYYGHEMVGPGKGHGKKLTAAGHELYDRGIRYLETLELMTTDAQPLVVRASDTIQAELLPRAVHKFLYEEGWLGKVVLQIRRIDYRVIKEQVLQAKTEFGLGWNVANERSSFVRSLQPGFHMGLIAPKDHPLAAGRPEEIRMKDVARSGSLLWCLHPEFQIPAVHRMLDACPVASRAHCSTYGAVAANVLAGNGVGIVPLWYWKLDKLRERCGLFYSRIQGMPPHFLTAYLPPCEDDERSGVERLSKPARALFTIIENMVWDLGMRGSSSVCEDEFSR